MQTRHYRSVRACVVALAVIGFGTATGGGVALAAQAPRPAAAFPQGTNFRLQELSPGATTWTEAQSRKNFEQVQRLVVPGNPAASRLLLMPLAEEVGGIHFHPGGKHFLSLTDPEWKGMADWVKATR